MAGRHSGPDGLRGGWLLYDRDCCLVAVLCLPVEREREVIAALRIGVERDAGAHVRVDLVAGQMAAARPARCDRDGKLAEDFHLRPREQHVNYMVCFEVLRRTDEPNRYVEVDANRQLPRDNRINLDTEKV